MALQNGLHKRGWLGQMLWGRLGLSCQQNNHNSFLIFSLNCQSLNAKFDEIKIQIETFRNSGCEISAFCLQETWLGEDYDTSLLQIEGYTLISQGKICSSHAGLAIYLNNKYKYKTFKVFEKSNIWESLLLGAYPRQDVAAQMSLRNCFRSSATLLAAVIVPNVSVMSFSHLCLGFPRLLFPATIPCIIVFSKPLCRVTWPKYLSFCRLTKLYIQFVGK